MAVYNNSLYVGGTFTYARGLLVNKIARWDGSNWYSLGSGGTAGVPTGYGVYALAVFQGTLYVGGSFPQVGNGITVNGIAKWNGTAWSAVSGGVSGGGDAVWALAVFDEDDTGPGQPALFVGGNFLHAGDVGYVNNIAKWNGSAWSSLSGGVTGGGVYALAVFDDDGSGSGLPGLYVGGGFTAAGGVAMSRIAKWSKVGSNMVWSKLMGPVHDGTNGSVWDLAVYDEDGSGPILPALYVGGAFTTAGDTSASRIAKWSRSGGTMVWSSVGGGITSGTQVYSLATFDEDDTDPNAPSLYVGGLFSQAGGVGADNVARWDGKAWYPLTTGVNNTVRAFAVFDADGAGSERPGLYPGGEFTTAGGTAVGKIARWSCVASPTVLVGDMNCDGTVDFKDINPFVIYMVTYSVWQSAYPGCDPQNGDINQDGSYPSFADINPFVILMQGTGQ